MRLTATVMQKPQHSHISWPVLAAACGDGGTGDSAHTLRNRGTPCAEREQGGTTTASWPGMRTHTGDGAASEKATPHGTCAHRATASEVRRRPAAAAAATPLFLKTQAEVGRGSLLAVNIC